MITNAVIQERLICNGCKEDIYTCNVCRKYFEANNIIFCEKGRHLCPICEELEYQAKMIEQNRGQL